MANVLADAPRKELHQLDDSSGAVESELTQQEMSKEASHTDHKRFGNLSWWAIAWLATAHLVVICVAPFTFTWAGLAVMLVLHWLAGSIGICLGYHRLLTHSGMKTYTWFKYVLAGVGCLAGEGPPMDWVADHRKHHKHSDQDGDPHSPREGAWWSHMLWLAFHTHNGEREAYMKRWAPDMYKLRGMHWMTYLFMPIHFVSGAILLGVGWWIGGAELGVSFLVWGLFVRLVGVLHSTWLVNSASHMWGYRNYETTDDSRNNWLVAILAYGEGWHNNHHAHPRMAVHGHKWWEFDITWQAIRLFRAVGLVWDVVDYRNAKEKKDRETAVQEKAAA
ncbi:MAG: acyl-CoA desaturase [Planctomycetota bacterium]